MNSPSLRKICVFTTVHRPYDVRVFHREARTLAAQGYSVTLLVHADFKVEEKYNVVLKGIPRPKNRFFRLLSIFRFAHRCLKENPDVYHFHDLELLPLGVFFKWVTKKRVIYDCHENYPEAAHERAWYPDWFKPLLARFIAITEPALAKQLDVVICVVPDQQERFKAAGCRTILLRNLPRLEVFNAALQKHPPKLDRIIYVGGLTTVRGAKLMVEIMKELQATHPSTKLLLLGPFNEPHVEKDVKRYIAELGLEKHIEHIQFVPHQDVAEYVVQSKIGLIPWQENKQMLRMVFPNKIFEYMACGLPVVASDLPSLRYILNKSGGGVLVKANDAKAHARAIAGLLDDNEKSNELGRKGREFVKKKFNWDIEAKKLVAFYSKL
ncbi:MAG: glycosyltransferase [Actinobacteria bacterium]|nr:glycosyltransferase [Actinomycetota bacterium]